LIHYLVSKAQQALQHHLKKQFDTEATKENATEWTLLLGSSSQMFRLYSDGDVETSEKPYMCIGDASDIANGVLYTHYKICNEVPWTVMETAYEACKYFKTSVRGPFHILQLFIHA
jgi:hypothetical protein